MKLFTPLILIGLCVAAYYMYINPSLTQVEALNSKKSEYLDVLAKAKDVIQKRDSINANYQSIPQEDKDRLNKFLPENFNNVLMANHLNSIANKHGMVIQDVELTQQDSGGLGQTIGEGTPTTYKTHTVSFFVVGSYGNFLSFLKDLELNLDLVDIKKLSIAISDAKNPKIQIFKYTFQLQTYSLK